MPRPRSSFRTVVTAALLVLAAVGVPHSARASTAPEAAAAPSAGCGKTPTLASGKRTIQSNGKSRSFILKLPDTYDNSHPHRLAFGYHWLGGTAEQVASGGSDGYAWAYYGMQSQAGNSTIFVAPQGLNNGWGNSGGEDVTFTDDMIRLIENDLCVDTTQLFSIGFSYGGAMSYALACARATVFRAVVAIAAPGAISGCSGGTQPIAYMGIHGVSDNIGAGRGLRDTFVRNNGCTPQNAPEPAPGSKTHYRTVYSGCRAGYPVVWAPFDGGHQQGPVDGCTGCESGARSWDKAEIWKFFSQFGGDPVPPTPPVQVGVNYSLVAAHSGKSADVSGGATAAGAALIQWAAHNAANQQFDFLASADGYYRIRARHSGLVLQVAGAGAGADITQQPDADAAAQQWRVTDSGGGAVTLVNRLSGLAMDVWGASTADGARISQYAASGGANQRFQLQRA
ncbi:RICIN domain-containing protein [Amycolatopsis sp. A133]|uniref:RICIN domain-containing protein n=1 Tax=Amycolatopsis sp. A133 TaxID=3064472 RepID=UPI0027E68936|nr:RICIN domain-containing protein [Amycolatopsis sp. A133]MDQ7808757.1 RICIN domain-containing protein [Amycolatopsis sp. A133]